MHMESLHCEFSRVLGIKLNLSDLAAVAFAHWAILPDPYFYFLTLCICAHVVSCPQELEEGFAYPAARIIGSCELPDMAGGAGIPVLY